MFVKKVSQKNLHTEHHYSLELMLQLWPMYVMSKYATHLPKNQSNFRVEILQPMMKYREKHKFNDGSFGYLVGKHRGKSITGLLPKTAKFSNFVRGVLNRQIDVDDSEIFGEFHTLLKPCYLKAQRVLQAKGKSTSSKQEKQNQSSEASSMFFIVNCKV